MALDIASSMKLGKALCKKRLHAIGAREKSMSFNISKTISTYELYLTWPYLTGSIPNIKYS